MRSTVGKQKIVSQSYLVCQSSITCYNLHAYEYPMNCLSYLSSLTLSERSFLVVPLSVSLCCVVSLVHDQVFWAVVFPPAEVAVQNSLGSGSIPLLRIERSTGHVSDHGISASEWVLCVTERVVLWRWLREPDIAAVAAEVAGLEGFGNVFFDDDGTTGRVDEPRAYRVSNVLELM